MGVVIGHVDICDTAVGRARPCSHLEDICDTAVGRARSCSHLEDSCDTAVGRDRPYCIGTNDTADSNDGLRRTSHWCASDTAGTPYILDWPLWTSVTQLSVV